MQYGLEKEATRDDNKKHTKFKLRSGDLHLPANVWGSPQGDLPAVNVHGFGRLMSAYLLAHTQLRARLAEQRAPSTKKQQRGKK